MFYVLFRVYLYVMTHRALKWQQAAISLANNPVTFFPPKITSLCFITFLIIVLFMSTNNNIKTIWWQTRIYINNYNIFTFIFLLFFICIFIYSYIYIYDVTTTSLTYRLRFNYWILGVITNWNHESDVSRGRAPYLTRAGVN